VTGYNLFTRTTLLLWRKKKKKNCYPSWNDKIDVKWNNLVYSFHSLMSMHLLNTPTCLRYMRTKLFVYSSQRDTEKERKREREDLNQYIWSRLFQYLGMSCSSSIFVAIWCCYDQEFPIFHRPSLIGGVAEKCIIPTNN